MTRKKLPIGIQTFREIREEGHYYVDKTAFAWRLVDTGKYYFLSRPRRFGKSLFLDTLAELFAGNEPLFRDLAVHAHWDWSRRFPVIRLSFGGGVVRSAEDLQAKIAEQLRINQTTLGITCTEPTTSGCFGELIRTAHAHSGERAVVLFDKRQFRPWWFETATPTFLVEVLTERHQFVPRLGHQVALESLLSRFDVGDIPTEALLFQTGYLTIDHAEWAAPHYFYHLRYPNLEVRTSLNEQLLDALTARRGETGTRLYQLHRCLLANDFAGLEAVFKALFAGIPTDWYRNNPIAHADLCRAREDAMRPGCCL